MTKKISNPIPEKVSKRFMELIIDFHGWHILNYSAHTIKSAIDISTEYGVHYWDALLAATMRENDVSCTYTENEYDLGKISWLKTINPFF